MNNLSNEELLEILRARLLKNEIEAPNLELIHELEKLSARLRTAERMKSSFLSHVRNELTNPVTSILGLSRHLAIGDLSNIAAIRHQARLLHREAFYLDYQIRNITAAAEIEAGEIYPVPSMLDPHKLVDNVINAFKQRAQIKNITLDVNTRGTNCTFTTDSYMLSIIVANLVANAIEYSADDSTICVDLQLGKENLSVAIKDTGVGIDPRDHPRIFDRFSQLNEGTTRTHTGLGLGLSIVSEFAEALGGMIKVQSATGGGSTFTLTLPAMQNADGQISNEWNEILFGDEKIF